MRRLFTAALADVPHHRMHFYCTTEPLAEQYNRMNVARFTHLPYPVRPAPESTDRRVNDGPLRVTCAGSVRLEKGRIGLARLVRRLLPTLQAEGRVQLVLQTDRKSLRQVLPGKLARKVEILPRPDPRCDWPVVPVDYPLDPDAYRELIRQADIGLFLYDPRRYYARCSGVLVDMLSAGIPVIVPAGCWLADQIHEPNYSYLDRLASVLPTHRWPGRTSGFDVPAGSRAALIRFEATARTRYFEVRTVRLDERQRVLGRSESTVLGRRRDGGLISTLLPLQPATRRLQVAVDSAYDQQPVDVTSFETALLDAPHPLGSVGLTTETFDRLPVLVQEIATHYRHYRRSAVDFAARWRHDHAASRTLQILAEGNDVEGLDRGQT
jgi:hypothetical protein